MDIIELKSGLRTGAYKIRGFLRAASIDNDLESKKRKCQPLITSLKRLLNQRKAQ